MIFICSVCKEEKPMEAKARYAGHARCKECVANYQREYRQEFSARLRSQSESRARGRAYRRLADLHREQFVELLDQERMTEGLGEVGVSREALSRRLEMKRTELKRTTPMKRGDSQLKRTGKLNQVSTKRKKENVKRRALTELTFADDPYCKLGPAFAKLWPNYQGCRGVADALHELQKRSAAGSITDPENCLLACNPCNSAVEDFPAVAWRCGLVLRAGDTYEDLERRRSNPEPLSAWLERKGVL